MRLLRESAAIVCNGRRELAAHERVIAGLVFVLCHKRLVRSRRAAAAAAVDDAQIVVRMLPPLQDLDNQSSFKTR